MHTCVLLRRRRRRRVLQASLEQERARGNSRKQLSHCLSSLIYHAALANAIRRELFHLARQSCRGPTPRSVRARTRLPVLPRFFTLLLLVLDKPCRLHAVAADVDRLLRLMGRRPASPQCSACYLKHAAAYLCSSG